MECDDGEYSYQFEVESSIINNDLSDSDNNTSNADAEEDEQEEDDDDVVTGGEEKSDCNENNNDENKTDPQVESIAQQIIHIAWLPWVKQLRQQIMCLY